MGLWALVNIILWYNSTLEKYFLLKYYEMNTLERVSGKPHKEKEQLLKWHCFKEMEMMYGRVEMQWLAD